MKNFLLLICIAISINLNAQVTRNEAINIVVDELISPYTLEQKWLFSKYEIMYLNDTLWLDDYLDYYTCPFDENWVFFVDDCPVAFWAHPCRYVFMDANNADYEIIDEDWPPYPFLYNYMDFLLEWEWILSTHIDTYQLLQNEEFMITTPNPFQNHLKINIHSDINEPLLLQLFDSNGRIVMSDTENKPLKIEWLVKLNTENLEAGIYVLIVSNKNQLLISKKLVKTD